MKNNCDSAEFSSPPKFAKTAREWILASALYDGIEDEDIRQIDMLVSERGANPNVLLPEYGISPFHLVVANESTRFAVEATDLCLQHGADPNVRSEDGLTPVHLAAMWGCSEVLHLLLASGGDPWLVDELGLNAFDYALRESQHHCYKILKASCNSQPKPSGCSRSPYQLNLKRVILYKNDLQIVYEASPTNAQKSSSTQTSPNTLNQIAIEGVSSKKNSNSNSGHKETRIALTNMDKDSNYFQNDGPPISSKLKDIIEKHRRNSMLFEYLPRKEEKDNLTSEVVSWKDTEPSKIVMTGFSDLVNKLDQTNKIRQSLKASDNSTDMLKNITQRKMPCTTPKPFTPPKFPPSEFRGKSTSCDNSYQHDVPQDEIGFMLNNTKETSSVAENQTANSSESPPSVGFILDNLSYPCNEQNSSLFSDIASDIEAFSTPIQDGNVENIMTEDEKSSDVKVDIEVFSTPLQNGNVENIMTEDEKSPDVKVLTNNSSSGSLYPYISCESTRGRESNEDFASCRNSNSFLSISRSKKEPPAIIDALNDYFEKHSRTSVNPKVITSTPEKSAAGSDEEIFLSVAGEQNDQNQKTSQPPSKKLSWVNATVASSTDEEPYMSISEEYEYTDMDQGVVLIEKRYLTKDISVSTTDSEKKVASRPSSSSECESVSTLSGSEGAYDTDELRRALVQHGFAPGPITANTKRVYLRKLKRCRKKPLPPLPSNTATPAFSPELLKTLSQPCEHLLAEWAHLEDSMSASFSCARRPWREGQAKTSFTYLLLDPRVAHSLPARAAANLKDIHSLWREFLKSVFYVGKGKRSRPYAHLYQAVSAWQQQKSFGYCKKIQRILDIWKSGEGVICLHVFLNVIPVEAFTREAAMICAMTLPQLTNEQVGKFYGSAASWSERLKRRLGCVLLHRAFKVFLAEGERQLRPADID